LSIGVFIDNNIWDFLFKHQLDLSAELPRPEFALCITSEAEFEHRALEHRKPELWAFINQAQRDASVDTDAYFGFADPELPPHEQRVGGWDFGRFISEEEGKFIAEQRQLNRPSHSTLNEKTRLFKQEADISLGARSFQSVVLTLDAKGGPLKDALNLGGMVLALTNFDPHTQKLSNVVRTAFKKV
jgi:hypothetical protein